MGPQEASDDFVEELLGFLLDSTQSRDKALRYRSTQLVAKIIELLPEDAGISDEVWEGVCEHMQVSRALRKCPCWLVKESTSSVPIVCDSHL